LKQTEQKFIPTWGQEVFKERWRNR